MTISLLTGLLLALKAPDSLIQPQFWAEDGAIFFAQQWAGRQPPFFEPYAGYLHFLPRLTAWWPGSLPAALQPLAFNVSALVLETVLLTYCAMRLGNGRLMVSLWCILAFMLVPQAGDVFGTITNVQWFAQFAMVVATLRLAQDQEAAPRPTHGRFAEYLMFVLCGLTGPFSMLWLGSIALVGLAIAARGWMTGAAPVRLPWLRPEFLVLLLVCALCQLLAMATSPIGTPEQESQMSPDLLAKLGLLNHDRHPYVAIVNMPGRAHHLGLLAVYGVLAATLLPAACRLRATGNLQGLAVLTFGACQPLAAYVKQQAAHTLATPSHYFLMLGAALIWLGGMKAARLFHQQAILNLGAACVFALAYLKFPDYFRRAPLAMLGWPRTAAQLETLSGACQLVALNPLPWHALIPPKHVGMDCKRATVLTAR
ncbi:MAG: hypothetical protein ACK44A_03335 [Roseateles sp.]